MLKGSFKLSIALFIVFAVSACSEVKKSEPEEIHFQVMASESFKSTPLGARYANAIDHFNERNPSIHAVIDYMPGTTNTSDQDIIKRLESSEPPDVVELPVGNIPDVKNKSLLRDLLPFTKELDIDIPRQVLDRAKENGKLLLLPYAAYPSAIVFNKDLFDSAKIEYPQGDWTWEQFRTLSQKINANQATAYGSVLTYDIGTLELLMASSGKGVLSPDGTTSVGYLDSPEAIRALQWLNAYYHDDRKKTEPASFMDTYNYFSTKKEVGMIVGGIGFSFPNMNIGVAPMPHFEGSRRANPLIGLSGYGISSTSRHSEAAWKLIEYMALSNNENSEKFAANYISTSKSLSEAFGQDADPVKRIYLDEMSYAVGPSMNNSPFFAKAWNKELIDQFNRLLATSDSDIPAKLHDLAMKLDQELHRLKIENDQQTTSQPQ
jgi:multiple sugar transport system substrate-binding protein